MRSLPLVLASTLAMLLTACGGGGGGLADAIGQGLIQIAPPIDHDLTATLSDSGVVTSEGQQYVGEYRTRFYRSMIAFDVAEPIEGRAFRGATLRLDVDRIGGDLQRLGLLWVEVVDLGDVLDAADFQRPGTSAVRVDPAAIQEGTLDIDVTDLMFEMFAAGRRTLQLRLRFSVATTLTGARNGFHFDTLGLLVDWE